jgi:uncharacterized membrane protein
MREVARQIEIDAPRERVWALLADLEGVAAWAPNIVECRLLSRVRQGVGAARRVRHATGIVLDEEVVAWDECSGYTYEIRGRLGPLRELRESWTVAPAPSSCVASATIRYDLRFGMLGRVVDRLLLRLLLRRQMSLGLSGLKRHAESRNAPQNAP